MAFGLPPTPVFPIGIDTDRTLYRVNNTVEALTSTANQPWSDEIQIVPVAEEKPEQWALNGFANIAGENVLL